MVKSIIASIALFLLVATAAAGAQPSTSSARAVTASTGACQQARLQCKAECSDLNGGALGACLRACDVEYKQCLAGQSSAMSSDLAALTEAQPLGTSPAQCYQQLEACGESCGGDIGCNRQCVKQYQKCMGH
jgi:hypothetical protein